MKQNQKTFYISTTERATIQLLGYQRLEFFFLFFFFLYKYVVPEM